MERRDFRPTRQNGPARREREVQSACWRQRPQPPLNSPIVLTTLTIENGKTLTIDSGVTLTNNGTITNNGTLTNNGTINGDGSYSGSGTVNKTKQTAPGTGEYSQRFAAGNGRILFQRGTAVDITTVPLENHAAPLPFLFCIVGPTMPCLPVSWPRLPAGGCPPSSVPASRPRIPLRPWG